MESEIENSEMEPIVGISKKFKDSSKRFKRTRKASASSGEDRNVMPQIGVDTFDSERIALVLLIANMHTGIDYVEISNVAIRTVILCIGSVIHYALDIFCRLFHRHIESDKLPRFTADYSKNIRIFAGFCVWLFADEPIQLIKFK